MRVSRGYSLVLVTVTSRASKAAAAVGLALALARLAVRTKRIAEKLMRVILYDRGRRARSIY